MKHPESGVDYIGVRASGRATQLLGWLGLAEQPTTPSCESRQAPDTTIEPSAVAQNIDLGGETRHQHLHNFADGLMEKYGHLKWSDFIEAVEADNDLDPDDYRELFEEDARELIDGAPESPVLKDKDRAAIRQLAIETCQRFLTGRSRLLHRRKLWMSMPARLETIAEELGIEIRLGEIPEEVSQPMIEEDFEPQPDSQNPPAYIAGYFISSPKEPVRVKLESRESRQFQKLTCAYLLGHLARMTLLDRPPRDEFYFIKYRTLDDGHDTVSRSDVFADEFARRLLVQFRDILDSGAARGNSVSSIKRSFDVSSRTILQELVHDAQRIKEMTAESEPPEMSA